MLCEFCAHRDHPLEGPCDLRMLLEAHAASLGTEVQVTNCNAYEAESSLSVLLEEL